MRPKARQRTLYVEALGRDVTVRGVPLIKLLSLAPGEPPIGRELDDIRHPAITRSIATHVVEPNLTPAVIDSLDDDTRFVIFHAIVRAHPETRRLLRDETRRAEQAGVR